MNLVNLLTAALAAAPATDLTSAAAPILGATPEAAARAVVAERAAALGLPQGGHLVVVAVNRTRLGASVRFEQRHAGLPVVDGHLVVTLTRDLRFRRLWNGLRRFARLAAERRIDRTAAIAAAADGIDGVRVHDGRPGAAAREVLVVRGDVAQAAYEVHLSHVHPLSNLYVLVDARTGERLRIENRVFFGDGVRIFDPSPNRDCDRATVATTVPDLKTPRDPDGHLTGNKLLANNCCYHENCDPAKPPKRQAGSLSFGGFQIQYDIVVCDRKQRASNTRDCRADYVYRWEPEPDPAGEPGKDPADEDPFSEVHGYVHAARAYEWFRTVGDLTFVLRDQKLSPPQPTLVWVNVLIPDLSNINPFGGPIKIDKFMRVDNAAYIPREQWAGLPPVFGNIQTDTLLFFQGPQADFAYDGDVVLHEFTHGMIFSTSGLGSSVKVDSRGAMDEGGAIHEGVADYFAAAMTGDPVIGDFVSPRIGGAAGPLAQDVGLRDLGVAYRCPEVIEGEVHQDSQHLSAALWAARQKLLGADSGKTYDGAVYDGVVSIGPTAGFADLAAAIKSAVGVAFGVGAEATFEGELTSRGVIGCGKVLDLVAPRPRFAIVAPNQPTGPWGATGRFAPGPIQFRVHAPQGATALLVRFTTAAAGFLGGGVPVVRLIPKVDEPITFTGAPNALTYNVAPTATATGSLAGTTYTMNVPITAPCGSHVHFALATEAGAVNAANLTATLTPDATCAAPDGGAPDAGAGADAGLPPAILCRTRNPGPPNVVCPPDAGTAPPDAGTPTPPDAGDGADAGPLPTPPGGCGCRAAGAAPALAAVALALWRRRRSAAAVMRRT